MSSTVDMFDYARYLKDYISQMTILEILTERDNN